MGREVERSIGMKNRFDWLEIDGEVDLWILSSKVGGGASAVVTGFGFLQEDRSKKEEIGNKKTIRC